MATRPTRSRVSSPFVAAGKNGGPETRNTKSDKSEKSESTAKRQTTLDSWKEPPSVIRPSFQDGGLERHSAVLNMQALGTLPPPKLLKQVAALQVGEAMGRDSTKRSGLSNESTPAESFATPDPPATPTQAETAPEAIVEDVIEAPETPKAQISDEQSVSRSEEAPQSTVEEISSVQPSPVPTTTISGQVPSRLQSESPIVPPIKGPDGKLPFNLEWTDKVVEAAVQEAVDQRRWPTAYGLRTLYDENRSDPDFIRLTEAIYYKYASNAQFEEFEGMLAPKKKEGRKDRTGEYYFNGDGSDPAPARSIVSFVQALNGPQREYRSVYSDNIRRSSSVATDPAPGASLINQSSNAATPNKEAEASQAVQKPEHNKPRASSIQANGDAGANGTTSKTVVEKFPFRDAPNFFDRSNSLSSSSSLSSVDEKLIANTGISPARPTSSHALASFGRFGVFDSNGVERPFVSPYASANNFLAAASSAETLARRNAQPIKKAPKPGPKIHTFSVTTTSVPAPAAAAAAAASSSSSTNNFSPINAPGDKSTRNSHNNNNNNTNSKSSSSSMAPAALLAASSNSSSASTSKYSPAFASKPGAKINAALPDDVEKRMKLKRAARDKTNLVRGDRSFERHKVHAEEDNETASEGEDSVAVAPPPAKRQKIRILNNSRPTRRNVNDDSDELSSPTFLNFHTDGPSSFPPSRAGTPGNLNRTTRKGKAGTGSGLRVKTSPMKKKQGSLAGIPRASGNRNSPVGNGNLPHNQNIPTMSGRPQRERKTPAKYGDFVLETKKPRSSQTKAAKAVSKGPVVKQSASAKAIASVPPAVAASSAPEPAPVAEPSPMTETVELATASSAAASSAAEAIKPTATSSVTASSATETAPAEAVEPAATSSAAGEDVPGVKNLDENEDFCASCGGGGELLCCDGVGCIRSFHFKCVDPPLSQDALPDSWLCHECQVKQNGIDANPKLPNIFRPLIEDLEARNSSAFHLPKAIRNYFEYVQTGPDGEYEEVAPPSSNPDSNPKPKQKTTAKEKDKDKDGPPTPDYFRLRDNKQNLILCHVCDLAAERPDRMIMGCDFCPLFWHIDCMPDGPMAKPPHPSRKWKCPAHVDDLLELIPAMLAPAHRFRRIRGVPSKKPAFARGVKNNGHIEIENEPTDDEEEKGMSFHEVREFGHILRLPELGVKLDFIEKVKAAKRKYLPEMVAPENFKRHKHFNDYSLQEQEAALTFKAMKLRKAVPGDSLNILQQALIDEMPDNVIDLFGSTSASDIAEGKPLTEGQRKRFRAAAAWMQAQLAHDDALKSKAAKRNNKSAPVVTPPAQEDNDTATTKAEPAANAEDEATVEPAPAVEAAPATEEL